MHLSLANFGTALASKNVYQLTGNLNKKINYIETSLKLN